MVLLGLHAAVLEPDLDLAVGELQASSHLQPPTTIQVGSEVELLLKLHQLGARESCSVPPPSVFTIHWEIWLASTVDWKSEA